jgi:exosortase
MRLYLEMIGRRAARRSTAILLVLAAGLAWAYWPVLTAMARRWQDDSRYAHGYLVPAFALVLLWMRRGRLAAAESRPSWWGVAAILAGSAIRLVGAYFYIDWLDAISLLPCLAGVALLLGGRATLAWSWPAVAFLGFMVPLPYRLEMALGWPLQRLATEASTYIMQTCGLSAIGEGNVITLESGQIGVVEACSGLSMMILFFAIATGVALVVRRPLLDRLLIVASALPIALISNIARITVTGLLQEAFGARLAHLVFHDLAGYLMMPLALVLLWLELTLLARLLIEVPAARQVPVGLASLAVVDGLRRNDRKRPAAPTRRP